MTVPFLKLSHKVSTFPIPAGCVSKSPQEQMLRYVEDKRRGELLSTLP